MCVHGVRVVVVWVVCEVVACMQLPGYMRFGVLMANGWACMPMGVGGCASMGLHVDGHLQGHQYCE